MQGFLFLFSCVSMPNGTGGGGGHSARFKHLTVDKVGSEKLLARKSCFV